MTTANKKNSFTRRGFRFRVEFAEYFGMGLYQTSDVRPDTEYTGDPNRPGPQRRDLVTGLLQWKVGVMDPGEENPRRASYEIVLLSDTEPVPTTQEIAPNVRPIELTGITVEPRLAGDGQFKYVSKAVRASGYAPGQSASGRGTGSASGSKSAS